MKKGLLLFTGILELIFFILVLILSIYNLAYQFLASTLEGFVGIEIAGMLLDVFNNMYRPVIDFLPFALEAKLMNIILAGLMIILSLMMVIFASKKLSFAKLADYEFATKRKVVIFFVIFEFLMFAGAVATFVLPTLTYGFMFVMLETIPQGISIFVTFIVFLFTAIQAGMMKKIDKNSPNSFINGLDGISTNPQAYPQTTYTQQYGPNPSAQGMYTQPQQTQSVSHYQPNMIDNAEDVGDLYVGYPDKVKADLERLDRLYANGALTPDSFQTMRTKIMQEMDVSSEAPNQSANTGVDTTTVDTTSVDNTGAGNIDNSGADVPPQA